MAQYIGEFRIKLTQGQSCILLSRISGFNLVEKVQLFEMCTHKTQNELILNLTGLFQRLWNFTMMTNSYTMELQLIYDRRLGVILLYAQSTIVYDPFWYSTLSLYTSSELEFLLTFCCPKQI